jgi:RimJ/RimL family protein N-acetyltransferase
MLNILGRKRPTLRSSRLLLRILTEDDASDKYAGWLNDPEVNQYLATKHATVEELRNYIRKKYEDHRTLFFGIFLHDGGTHVGTIKLDEINFNEKTATIAIMIGDKRQWGKGLATEALQILISYAFEELDLNEIKLGVIGQNNAAIRVYERLGFYATKREFQAVNYGGILYDQVNMVLRRHEQSCLFRVSVYTPG